MNVTIHNLGTAPVPILGGSSSRDPVMTVLDQASSYTIEDAEATVVSVGDNPSFFDEVKEAVQAIGADLARLIGWLQEREAEAAPEVLSLQVQNDGSNPLRLCLGSNVNEAFVAAGARWTGETTRYLEIREQGV